MFLKKAIRTENSSLTKEVQDLKAKQNDQVMYLVDPETIFTTNLLHSNIASLFVLPFSTWYLLIVVLICECLVTLLLLIEAAIYWMLTIVSTR